jgi:hypothetical protein
MLSRSLSLLLLIVLWFPAKTVAADPITVGTTFSPQQCEYLELDWRETYQAILALDFDVIRLGAYWSFIEAEQGIYDFTDLDWQIEQAEKHKTPVILTVGIKAPRWPEYFIPDWVFENTRLRFAATVSKNLYLQNKALKFIEHVVNRYKGRDIIRYWQVENEALNRFGGKYWRMDKGFLAKEVALVRELDAKDRPVLLTTATYPNWLLNFISAAFTHGDPIADNLELGDILGINIYPIIGQKFWQRGFYVWSGREKREIYFSQMLSRVEESGKELWITELQAEPWEPGHLVYTVSGRPPTGWPESTKLAFQEMRAWGYRTFLLWGAEYWYYQKTRHDNPEWWRMAEEILKNKNRRF